MPRRLSPAEEKELLNELKPDFMQFFKSFCELLAKSNLVKVKAKKVMKGKKGGKR